jgi:PhnB protein
MAADAKSDPRSLPDGLTALTPQLVVKDARASLRFLQAAFDATVSDVIVDPVGGGVMRANVTIEGATLFVAEPFEPARPTRASFFLRVVDVDATVKRAVRAGTKVVASIVDSSWGYRWAIVEDDTGNQWQIATLIEDLTSAEITARMRRPW